MGEQAEAPEPQLLWRGRAAASEMPNGDVRIMGASPLCERCSTCGCGEQEELVSAPAMAVAAWRAMKNGNGKGALGMAREMMRRG